MRKCLFVLALLAVDVRAQDQPKKPALLGFDPVELVAGREVKGNPEAALQRGKFGYAFASEANRKAFEKDPERYAIQFGGACMRMGPLSGGGNADRYHVFDGRIYVFASEACRTGFKSDPRRFIDVDDDAPQGSADAAKKAEELLRKAVAGIGGEKALKDLATYQRSEQITLKQGDKDYKYQRLVATAFPATHIEMDDYGTSKFGWLLRADDGYLSWEKDPVQPSVRRHMIREFYRAPIPILRAWQSDGAKAFHLGPDKIADTPVERVAVGIRGATTTLAIDPSTGRILRTSYRGRTSSGIRQIDNEYSDFRNEGDLIVPYAVKTSHDGKLTTSPVAVVGSIRVNTAIDPALLRKPE